ncbi:hypothetical protein NHQ30_000608 [Ciborinia camelliae]|nr:hypothetical protein NHQ30_000608 [Ciborinia camelliae]
MPSKQRTFELVDAPKVIRPMTSKQAKKAYQKANRTPRISKAEQKQRDAEELARHRKAYEKEQAAAKAKAARDKKAAKALEQKEERKRLGIPEPSRHVRASQSRISMFIKQGNKRLRETENNGEESEDTLCGDLDEEPPTKRVAHDNSQDEDKALSKPTAPRDFEYDEETSIKQLANNNFEYKEEISAEPIVPDNSEDEFGDFPPLSDNDISLLDTSSMHSTPVNAISGRPRSAELLRPPFHKSTAPFNYEPELPRMKNFEREQMSPEDPFQLECMLDSQIRSEAEDAAGRSDCKQAVSIKEDRVIRDDMRHTASTSNKDTSAERELLWHAPINFRHDLPVKSTNGNPQLALPMAPAVKVLQHKQKNSFSNLSLVGHQSDHLSNKNTNIAPIPRPNSRPDFQASAISLPLSKKSLEIDPSPFKKITSTSPDRTSSRITGVGRQVLQESSFNSAGSKSLYVESRPHKFPTLTPLKQQQYQSRKSPVQASTSVSHTRSPLQERSINMGPPPLPRKSKLGMPLAPSLETRQIVNSFSLPPSSTQAFLESHLDEFFPSPTQEARELCEDSIIYRSSTSLKTGSAIQTHNQKPEDMNDTVDDDFGGMLSTQELKMFSQGWETANSPSREEEEKENENDSSKQIAATSEDIENLICSQDSIFSIQKLDELESVSEAKLPTTNTSHLPQAEVSKFGPSHYSTPMPQHSEPLHTSTPQIDPEMELTPKPRRSPWFKEKPEDKYTKKRFFTEKPEDLEAAAIAESKKAWEEIKEATSSNRHNFDDDPEREVDELFKAALAESKEWDEVYKAVVPTPTPRKRGGQDRKGMTVEEKGIQTPSRVLERHMGGSSFNHETRKFERAASEASTDYGGGEDSDWDEVLEGL